MKMALEMDFFPGQVVQWKTYEQAQIPCGKQGNKLRTKVHTGIFVGCITACRKFRNVPHRQDSYQIKDIYPIAIEMLKGQGYADSCAWLVKKLIRADREKEKTYSPVQLGGARHYSYICQLQGGQGTGNNCASQISSS